MDIALARGRIGVSAVIFVALAVLAVGVAYAAGMINNLGYEHRRLTYGGGVSGTDAGGGYGLKTMPFFAGQIVYVDYNVTVRKGSFRIGVMETYGPIGNKPHHVKKVSASESGEMTYRIPKAGIYTIYFDGSVLGNRNANGYDVSYSVRWGVR